MTPTPSGSATLPQVLQSVTRIDLSPTGLVRFFDGTNLLMAISEASELRRLGNVMQVTYKNAAQTEFQFWVNNLTLIEVSPTKSQAFTSVGTTNYDEATIVAKANSVYDYLTENVFVGCCKGASPIITGGLLVEVPDFGSLPSPGPQAKPANHRTA
jgi:hypothetical protein